MDITDSLLIQALVCNENNLPFRLRKLVFGINIRNHQHINRQINRQNGNKEKAATISAVPLTSEHQAGLAVDLSTDGTLLETFADTKQGQWLKEHCAEYGFILRYLPEKTLITGIINEPWHFRYVGSPAQAEAITESGLCMEEYFNKYLADEDLDPYLPYLK